jgi:hypothetical protein
VFPLTAAPDNVLADVAVMCAHAPRVLGIPQSQEFHYLVARCGLEIHAAQDSLRSILGRVCRVLNRHFPAVFRPAVEFLRIPIEVNEDSEDVNNGSGRM